MRKIAATILAGIMAAGAQQQTTPPTPPAGQTPAADGIAKFSSTLQMVIETVSVTDKSGKPIEGLKAEDFTVTENGVVQTLKFCDYMNLPLPGDTPVAFATRPEDEPKPAAAKAPDPKVAALTSNQIAPEPVGDLRYRNKRLLTIYFDMSAMPIPDQLRAFSATLKFIKTQTTSADLLAIMQYSNGAVKVMQDFTADRDLLLGTLDKLMAASEGLDENGNDDAASDTGAAFGQDDGEFNIFNTDRQLAALQTAVKMLGTLNEKKSLIYFASGLRLNGIDNQAQMRSTVNSAVRANVVMYPIDARGLVASAPLAMPARDRPAAPRCITVARR